jgi:polysaccharide export outer membrane protein
MNSRSLLTIAILAPIFASGLLCSAQDQKPAAPPATTPAAPTTAPPPGQAQPPATTDSTYVIGYSDALAISVWREPTLSTSTVVRPDGMISIPLGGEIQAKGLTPTQLAEVITTKLKKYVQDPYVAVIVTGIHSKLIYFIGNVAHVGPMEMTPNMTLLEAISSAGGPSEMANKKKIYILRDEGGKRVRIPLNYKDAIAGRAIDPLLKPGDTIVIP